jgi:hypothetical protein
LMKNNVGMALVCMVNSTSSRRTNQQLNDTIAQSQQANDSCSFYSARTTKLDYEVTEMYSDISI